MHQLQFKIEDVVEYEEGGGGGSVGNERFKKGKSRKAIVI